MSLSNGFDVRASSLVSDVDAAIERVVAHFEDNDIALRVDVLRALAAQAKLAFETERMHERLRQHPITRDLVDGVSTQSSVYERLAAGLRVQEFSSAYDAQRNVEILATVQWLLKEDDGAIKQKKKKARRASKAAVDRSVPLILRYAYSRSLSEDESTTLVEFRVTSSVGDSGKPKELVHFAMSSSSPYPRSFYEDQNDGGDLSDDDEGHSLKATEKTEDQNSESEEEQADSEAEANGEEGSEAAGEEEGGKAAGEEEQQLNGPYGEAVEAFAFDESEAVDDILTWLGEDNVDPADVIGFFLALPVYEDEWQLDERITEIVFNQSDGGEIMSGDESDQEEE